MTSYRLTYFDFAGSRGEECRLALFVAGVPFEDRRISQSAWAALKADTPYAGLPILDLPGKRTLAQSNAILAYVGRAHGLLPDDAWEAARHLAVMEAVEELRAALVPSGKISTPSAKKRAREEFAATYLKTWASHIEGQIVGPFVAGEAIGVADLKLYQITSSFKKGVIDDIAPEVFASFGKIEALFAAVAAHPRVVAWQSRR